MTVEHSEPRTTPAVTVCFPNVFQMRSYKGGTPSYSVRLMFDKSNKEHMDFLKLLAADMKSVLERQWPDEATRPRIPVVGHDKSPIKDGDKNCNGQGIPFKEKNPEVAGHFFFNCSKYTEGLIVVDRNKAEILNKGDIYSGCKCKVNINAYARTRADNPGVSIGLNGVQKWEDGERIGGGAPSVDEMFTADSGADDPNNYDGDGFFGGQTPTEEEDIPF